MVGFLKFTLFLLWLGGFVCCVAVVALTECGLDGGLGSVDVDVRSVDKPFK